MWRSKKFYLLLLQVAHQQNYLHVLTEAVVSKLATLQPGIKAAEWLLTPALSTA